MRKTFAQNVLFLVFVNLIVKPLWIFGIDAKVQTTLGNEVYGNYIALFNIGMILQIVLDLGLQSYSTKTVAHSPNTFQKIFPNIIITKLILTVLYFAILFIAGWSLGYPLAAIGMLISIGCIHAFNSFYLFFRSNIASKQLFKTDSILSVIDRLLLIVTCGVLLYVPYYAQQFSIQTFIVLQICTLAIASIIGYYLCNKHFHISWAHLGFKKIKVILKQGLPIALLILLMAIYMRGDAIMIEKILGANAAGQYAMALRLLDVANNMSGVLLAGMLLSFFSKHLKDKNTLLQVIKLCNKVLLPFAILVMFICFHYGQEIFQLIYHKNQVYDNILLGTVMTAFVFYCCLYIYSTLLTANSNINTLLKISAIAVALNITGNLLLIPQLDILGAAITHAVTIAFVAIACIMQSNKIYKIQFMVWQDLVQYLTYIICIVASILVVDKTEIHTYVQIILIGMICFLLVAAFNYQAIRQQISKLKSK